MSDSPTPHRSRWGAAAGLVGAALAFTAVVGAGPAPSVLQLAGSQEDVSGPCDEAEHATDPACAGPGSTVVTIDDHPSTTATDGSTSTTVGGSPSTTLEPGSSAVRSIDAHGAGTVTYVLAGSSLRLVGAQPSAGWRVEVEQAAGREIELDFRSGSAHVQVNLELEDGVVRVRVRTDGDDTATTVPGSTSTTSTTIDDGDHSGPGHDGSDDGDDDHSGHGHDGSDDDSSGHSGSGRDHPEDD